MNMRTGVRRAWWRVSGAVLILAVLAGCGGGGGGGGESGQPLNGAAVKGPLTNADAIVYRFDATAPGFKGAMVASATTDGTAALSGLALKPPFDPLYILEYTSTAATKDLTTGQAPVLPTLRTVITDNQVQAGTPVYATPQTTMATDIAVVNADSNTAPFTGNNNGTATAAEFESALAVAAGQVASTVGFGMTGVDLFTTPPLLTEATDTPAKQAAVAAYRTAVEALTAVLTAMGGGSVSAVDVLAELTADLADSVIDGTVSGVASTILDAGALAAFGQDPTGLAIPNAPGLTVGAVEQQLVDEMATTGASVDTSGLSTGTADPQPAQGDPDLDDDGILNASDNCPSQANPGQLDTDADGQGNACDSDDDNDGTPDGSDPCPLDATDACVAPADADGDGVSDSADLCPGTPAGAAVDADGCAATQLDDDADGVSNADDLCPATSAGATVDADGCAASQLDDDGDGVSNADDLCPATPAGATVDADGCAATQLDDDADGVSNADDLCPATPADAAVDADGCAASQLDDDADGVNNANDLCPGTPAGAAVNADGCADTQLDSDGDGVPDSADVCPGFDDTVDTDADGTPDGCDVCPADADNDSDGDGVCAGSSFNPPATAGLDNCPSVANAGQADIDGDGFGDACDDDRDGDGVANAVDNCPNLANADQADTDGDGIGDACDPLTDSDGDGVPDSADVCPGGDDTVDTDADGTPDFCDPCPADPTDACVGTTGFTPDMLDGVTYNSGHARDSLMTLTFDGAGTLFATSYYADGNEPFSADYAIDPDGVMLITTGSGPNTVTRTVELLAVESDHIQIRFTSPGGTWEPGVVNGNPDLASFGNSAQALADFLVAQGTLWDMQITADGKLFRPGAPIIGTWHVTDNVFYFDQPDFGGGYDSKAFRLEADQLLFATDAPGTGEETWYFGAYSQANLSGDWVMHHLALTGPSGSNGWARGEITLDGAGDVIAGSGVKSNGDPLPPTGSFTLALGADGVITDSSGTLPDLHGVLAADKQTCFVTLTEGGGASAVFVMQRRAEWYTQEELAGTWHVHTLSGAGAIRSGYGIYAVDPTGAFTLTSEGGTAGLPHLPASGGFSLDTDGTVISSDNATFHGLLGFDKRTIVATQTLTDGDFELLILQKESVDAPTYAQEELGGTWAWHVMALDVAASVWGHGEYQIDLAGGTTVLDQTWRDDAAAVEDTALTLASDGSISETGAAATEGFMAGDRRWAVGTFEPVPGAVALTVLVRTDLGLGGGGAPAPFVERVSVGDVFGFEPVISATGRYVAFDSIADNLVPGDTNGASDIFVHDRVTGTTERVSVDGSGAEANGVSFYAAISADGRYVAFDSGADNLVPGDGNSAFDVFVHDRLTGTTERVSVDAFGFEGDSDSFRPAFSADGRYVAFESYADNLVDGDTNGEVDTFVYDRQTGATERVSTDSLGGEGNGASYYAAISADGWYVTFRSLASNLVPADGNGEADVFVHDRWTGTTERATVDSTGTEGNGNTSNTPALSADGRYVAFYSEADNLVDGDTNGTSDIFVHDRVTGTTERVSVDSGGGEENGGALTNPSISADGRFVTFASFADNLVPGDTNGAVDVFMHDRLTGTTWRIPFGGSEPDGTSDYSVVSADGRYTAFVSDAGNLVAGDTNGIWDAFVALNPFAHFDPAADDDGDGLTNGDELTIYFTHYFLADSDGDGVDDGAEVTAGTDPLDPFSF